MKHVLTFFAALLLAAPAFAQSETGHGGIPLQEFIDAMPEGFISAEDIEGLTDAEIGVYLKEKFKPKPYVPPPFSDLAPVGLEQDARDIAAIMTAYDFPKVKRALNIMAISMTEQGVTAARLRAIEASGEDMPAFFERSRTGPITFSDAMLSAESAILGTVDDPVEGEGMTFSGPLVFNVNVNHQLSGAPLDKKLMFMNAIGSHSTSLQTGMECVFFPSQTRTRLAKFARPGWMPDWVFKTLPDSVTHVTGTPFCSGGSNVFSRSTQIGGRQSVTRAEVMAYVGRPELPR